MLNPPSLYPALLMLYWDIGLSSPVKTLKNKTLANTKNSVTGGNNGIGFETVKALLQSSKPYHILMGSRSLPKAAAAISTLQKECPESTNTVEAVQVDLTSDGSIEKAFEQVKASPGKLDILINNAGKHSPSPPPLPAY